MIKTLFFCTFILSSILHAKNWNGYTRNDIKTGDRMGYVITPQKAAPGNPWVLRARFPNWHIETDLILLKKGFHIAYTDVSNLYGSPKAIAQWDQFYQQVTKKYKLSSRVSIECVSRGGLIAYNWAKKNPSKVACIYAEVPVCDLKSWPGGKGTGKGSPENWKRAQEAYGLSEKELLAWDDNPLDHLEALAKARVPILHVIGLNDSAVPAKENTFKLFTQYTQAGGIMTVYPNLKGPQKASGHHFPIEDVDYVAQFIIRHSLSGPDFKKYFIQRSAMKNSHIIFERKKHGRVAFLGGSITYNPGWRPMLCKTIQEKFPQTKFDFIHAGIPSFGSTPHAFRFSRDVWKKGKVDLLFVEAAVNDRSNNRTSVEMIRGMEGIVCQAQALNPEIDIVFFHFADPSQMKTYNSGKIPVVIQAHEKVAQHYQINSLNLSQEVTERINAGEFTWADDFKNLHPSPFGQKIYHRSMKRMLDKLWNAHLDHDDKITATQPIAPLDPYSYSRASFVDIKKVKVISGFVNDPKWHPKQGGTRPGFVDVPALVGNKPGDTLRFSFNGRGVGIFVAAGYDAGTIEFKIDNGAWKKRDLFTPWSSHLHLPTLLILAPELKADDHQLTLRIIDKHNPRSKGNACRIFHFAVNR